MKTAAKTSTKALDKSSEKRKDAQFVREAIGIDAGAVSTGPADQLLTDHRFLSIFGVRENNLKNLDVQIPHDRLVVITGVSGSGKSTLAFDTIYAEGARRYIETFSPYTRQFLDRLHQPEIDRIEGVRPALALEQRNRTMSARSTVGTVTEINDYLKILWASIATFHCPRCDIPVKHDTPRQIALQLLEDARNLSWRGIMIGFPLKRGESSAESFSSTLLTEGFVRFALPMNSEVFRLEDFVELENTLGAIEEIFVVVDRLLFDAAENSVQSVQNVRDQLGARLSQTLSQAYHFGHGELVVVPIPNSSAAKVINRRYLDKLSCHECGSVYQTLRPSAFTFNSPLGACTECSGFGRVLEVDPRKIVPDDSKSIQGGALVCWTTAARAKEIKQLKEFCRRREISLTLPWRELSVAERDLVLHGSKAKGDFKGVFGWFQKLMKKRRHLHVRVLLSRYRSEVVCPRCKGGRLREAALCYRLNGKTLRDVWFTPFADLIEFLSALETEMLGTESVEIAFKECLGRLRYLEKVGLNYLTLDRQSRTLSGGEFQRVNLTSLLGSNLVHTTLVLDEPTIALHPRDTQRLLQTLFDLRDRGNTVVAVEHEQELIRAADHVLDLGPLSGNAGGECVYEGPLSGLLRSERSLTGQYLSGAKKVSRKPRNFVTKSVLAGKHPSIRISGGRAHNLKDVEVSIPLGGLVVITGVSGSGKSSLIEESFYKTYDRRRAQIRDGVIVGTEEDDLRELSGLSAIDEIVMVDQSPVGKTPRSNPGTYTKAWDHLREAFAATPDAERLGLGKSAFSFNVVGGRCAACEGAGFKRIEMQFLADVFVECEVCNGKRFKTEVLSVQLNGRNVEEVLNMTLDDCTEFLSQMSDSKSIAHALRLIEPLRMLGLGYLRIGQPLNEVSGGEAQRIKLSSYLTSEKNRHCVFLLDEPTTGLHPENINSLLKTFDTLIAGGHTIVCVEHNTDVIRNADWMIDVGPEGGEAGGRIVVQGVPAELLADEKAVAKSETLQCMRSEALHGSKTTELASPSVLKRPTEILIQGARENNLKNITVGIPRDLITIVTGVSGSGKSTLAFDILFQEGQRRYIDCLSPYARQYLTQVTRAEVDQVDSIPPTIAISQKTAPPVGISTLATTTELYQFLRLLFAKVGKQCCPDHGVPISGLSPAELAQAVIDEAGTKRVFVFAPVVDSRKGYYTDLFDRALRAEIDEARVDGKLLRIASGMRLERQKLHTIALLVGQLSNVQRSPDLLEAAVRQALLLGSGTVEVAFGDKNAKPQIFSAERMCPICRRGFRELDPRDFSFRSERGLCGTCGGRGYVGGEDNRDDAETCPECLGARIDEIGRNVTIGGYTIHELALMNAREMFKTLEKIKFDPRYDPVVKPIVREISHRLKVIDEVGLGYLSLDRDASSISGGEAQRLRLARTLGSPLSGVCYVFDEPTIGLHPEDHGMLMSILRRLRDRGNTVVIVEHDEETIAQGDHIIDIGPVGGRGGGELVSAGPLATLLQNERSVTARALRDRLDRAENELLPVKRLKAPSMLLTGATRNNLQNLTAEFPLNQLTVVCGVSGSGKSSLVHGSLVPAAIELLTGEKRKKGDRTFWKSLEGAESLERLLEIDQAPVGRTSASTPASYLGVFDEIRKIFALLPEARARGWTASHFSFNSGKGRCPTCQGRGFTKIPMSFLPDATLLCEECAGQRYTLSTLEVRFQGLSIGDILQRTMSDAKEIFANHAKVKRLLGYVDDLGLGYLTLGQPTHTLSGGEAQRLKIARELGAREAAQTLYILDEPTIGLHMADVDRLMNVVRRLIEKGNTVVVIEHNLDVISAADYVLELGPGPGEQGGQLVFSGTPGGFQLGSINTPTSRAYRNRREQFQKLVKQSLESRISIERSVQDINTLERASEVNVAMSEVFDASNMSNIL